MKFTSWALSVFVLVGCAKGLVEYSSLPNGAALPVVTGANVVPLTVNGSTCSSNSYSNKPCVSVTVCSAGNARCQVINDILLDTGSTGLRVFRSVLSVPLSPVTQGSRTLAECAQFGDGSSDWGPVELGNVILGGEPAVQVPIHIWDAGYVGAAQNCNGAFASPADAGFNGILGVAPLVQDCGASCLGSNAMYFSCNGASCAPTGVPLSLQIQNPVALLPTDNNGVIVELPSVSLTGAPSVNGYLVLGIGTRSNNSPSGAITPLVADATYGEITTTFNGQLMSGLIDTGSNNYYLPNSGALSGCQNYNSSLSNYLCPSSPETLFGVLGSVSGATQIRTPFQIGNYFTLASSGNNVFNDSAAYSKTLPGASTTFVWGLPFHLGRNIYVGFEGKSSSLGNGPLWAF